MRADRRRAAPVAIVALLAGAAAVLPLALLVVTGGTSPEQFAARGIGLPDPWTAANLAALLRQPDVLLQPMLTTAAATAVVTAVQLLSSVLAAYVFVRIRFPGRGLLLAITVAGYLVPPVVTLLPVFLAFSAVGIAGGFLSLVLPSALASPFAVLLLRQWIAGMPSELFDAAELDGAGHLTVLRRLVVPLSAPAITAAALAAAVSTWNSYLWPRLIAGVRLPQLQVAMAGLQTEHQDNWTLVMAAAAIAVAPPIAATLLLSRRLIATFGLGRRP